MHLFVSRTLEPHSPIARFARKGAHQLTAFSLVAFEGVPFTLPTPWPQWIFFYSKQGVHFFFERLAALRQTLSPQVRLAALGPGTARALHKAGHTPHFIGTGDPQATARAFRQMAQGQRVWFPRAQHSRRSVQRLLNDAIHARELVAYRNTIRRELDLPQADVLVFTSPLNAQAWYQQRSHQPEQAVVAIGPTTARSLHALGIVHVHLAPRPSEQAIVEVLARLP